MAPQFVRPYVKTNKSDACDAEAICEAVSRPTMRFVPIKTAAQQAILALHRARQGFVKARTAQANQLRSLLAEFGIVFAQGTRVLLREVPRILSDPENGLADSVLEQQITHWHKSNDHSRVRLPSRRAADRHLFRPHHPQRLNCRVGVDAPGK